MAEKYFVDTNILIYAHDRSGSHDPSGVKHERARQLMERLWTSGQGVLSTQVLQELCVNLRRKVANPVSVDELRALLRDYLSWEIVVNTPESVIQALEIETRYRTSFWDALILQAAEQCGATVLYSEDLAGKQSYGTVRVVNPLVG
ncbi:MAG: PIN domain-containing protein [Candidatus Sulfotelmatobacter sp.]